ncbi:MAG: LytTR family DNA-binding domain-containing protein [Bacteroidia bacterium]|nr:LytTR family DNA-binding domain-containing protein [Bacteroidia bacterium]
MEDDPVSSKVLENYILKTDFLHLVNSYSSAVDALNNFKNEVEIHLIFLDIEMPEMNGIEFMNSLTNFPQIIIVSAKEKYALEAFLYNVTDYLLKPVSYSRFFKAVNKARIVITNKKEIHEIPENKEIFVKNGNALIRILFKNILYIEALENYVIISTYKEKYTIHSTMKMVVEKLPSADFIRIHRSFIINIKKIHNIEENSVSIRTIFGLKTIPIGKSYKSALMANIYRFTT